MEQLKLLVVGDTNLQGRSDPTAAFGHVRAMLAGADVRIAHLEGLFGPTTQPDRPDLPYKPRWRHSEPEMVQAFAEARFDLLCCASNVAYGREHVLKTIELLDAGGIAHAGIGRNITEAQRPAVVERNGLRVGLLSQTSVFWPEGIEATAAEPGAAVLRAHTAYEPGRRALEMPGAAPIVRTWPNEQDLQAFVQRVAQLKRDADIAVVSCHWGISGSHEPAEYQRTVARAAIDAGADLVFGHHPHVLQPVEVYNGRAIFYSLGNFAFDWEKMRGRALDGIALRLTAGRSGIVEIGILPTWRDPADNTVRFVAPMGDPNGRRIIEQLQSLSTETASMEASETQAVLRL